MNLHLSAVVGLACALLATRALAGPIEFHDFWVAETPPGATATAAFVHISNATGERIVVTDAATSACERVEFHHTQTTDGVARMVREETLEIDPGEMVVLEPGGRHMMLIRPTALRAGERVTFTFTLASGATITQEAPVKQRGAASEASAGHEHHH